MVGGALKVRLGQRRSSIAVSFNPTGFSLKPIPIRKQLVTLLRVKNLEASFNTELFHLEIPECEY